ncbi:MAG: 30S ribosomal protein S8 [Ureaplasma sp.]|nr:30S ribosomal protein S8 [Ureaplasma sp.]MDE6289173.1 30S ribosomal protein S8 [Ureaplasma sp.]
MHIDPIAELLTKIRNAKKAKKSSVSLSTTKMRTAIIQLLLKEGYIKEYNISEPVNNKSFTTIKLKYKGKDCSINGLRQISKPGLRIYSKAENLPKVLNGLGIAIISTSKGIMTDKQARELNIGGEVIAYIW